MNKIHHSLADWTFDPDGNFYIDNSQYVSPPTSLACPHTGGGSVGAWFFLKPALGANIPEGILATYERYLYTTPREVKFFFRSQALPINSRPANTYLFSLLRTTCSLQQWVDNVGINLKIEDLSYTRTSNTWFHHRLTFYTWLNVSLRTVLTVIFETEIGGSWVQQLTHDIIDPLWQGSPTNRVGFAVHGSLLIFRHWVDDTEVWRKT
ncbi:hypothetical protein ES703_67290 [subsurface metagenome]